jgi:hypothetical protein
VRPISPSAVPRTVASVAARGASVLSTHTTIADAQIRALISGKTAWRPLAGPTTANFDGRAARTIARLTELRTTSPVLTNKRSLDTTMILARHWLHAGIADIRRDKSLPIWSPLRDVRPRLIGWLAPTSSLCGCEAA